MELFDELIHSGCIDLEAGWCQPLISYMREKKMGRLIAPFVPKWDLMPLHKLCQQALLWNAAGFQKEAGQLSYWLLQFADFLPLWCPESEFNEKEARLWFSRLSEIKPHVPDQLPDFGLTLSENAVFTLSGKGTSLGMIRAGEVEIRALGPQSGHLHFGIQGDGLDGWTRTAAFPEVWFESKPQILENGYQIDLRFVGLTDKTPLQFAFYVKAQSCQIGHELLKPKSLRRFNGETTSVVFQNVRIESSLSHKIEVIPLAGEGCFWDCEFLAAFEIHPLQPQVSFKILALK
jgi:hypothetical protein